MMFGRKPLTAAAVLILVMNVLRGQTQTCHSSEYWTGAICCPMCPAGRRVKTDCTKSQSTPCVPCTEGTFMNRPNGLTQCLTCNKCDADFGLKIKTSCTTTSDTVCEPVDGFFCLDPAEDGCVAAEKHKHCQPGQHISQTGTSSRDTECSDCSDGTYSDGTFTSCQTHTQCESLNLQLIKAGTVSTDAECREQSSDWTGRVISIVVVVLFVLFLFIIAGVYIWKKKCSPKGRNRNVDDPEQQSMNSSEWRKRQIIRCSGMSTTAAEREGNANNPEQSSQ